MSHHILEYNGMDVKKILQKEYDRHQSEFERHNELYHNNLSIKQSNKRTKHFHKAFQTCHIAELFGIILKRKDKNKELKMEQLEQEFQIWNEALENCEKKIKKIRDELRELRYGKC